MLTDGRIFLAAGAAIAFLTTGGSWAQDAAPGATEATVAPQAIIEGTWKTQKASEITIAPCEGGFCGRITKIVVPQEYVAKYGDQLDQLDGKYFDYNNKDPALRNRPIQDLQILQVHAGNNPWVFDGEVYNPEDGNMYSGYIQVIDPDRIKLNGCVLYNLICLGEEWVRTIPPPAEAPVPAEASLRPQ